jgi:hypothetical protein
LVANETTKLKNVAVYDTHAKGTVILKNILGNSIIKFSRPVLEDKIENMTKN